MSLLGLRDTKRERGAGDEATRYQMREQLIAFGDDYWIENDRGDRVFKVDGKALRLRKTLDIEDADGTHLCRIQTRVLHLRDTMAIERPDGDALATVHRALLTPLRERWKVDVADGPDLEVRGNILDHEYEIEDDGHTVAEVSKQWFRLRDTYGISVSPEADTLLVLAVAVTLDVMTHPDP